MVDNRNLYPDDTRFERDAPDGWCVYEVKSDDHVLFVHDNTDTLAHVEGDGMATNIVQVSQGHDVYFRREADTFDHALTLAEGVMNAYHEGYTAD